MNYVARNGRLGTSSAQRQMATLPDAVVPATALDTRQAGPAQPFTSRGETSAEFGLHAGGATFTLKN